MSIKVIKSESESRDILLLFPAKSDLAEVEDLSSGLDGSDHTILLVTEYPASGSDIEAFVDQLANEVSHMGFRWVYCIGCGDGTVPAQALAIRNRKLVRRLMLVDAHTGSAENYLYRLLDRIEAYIPCGLPLRKLGDDFDSRSEIHRVHTPTLVLVSGSASSEEREQSDFLSERLPNVWKGSVKYPESGGLLARLEQIIREAVLFKEVPVKSPQKNR
jgi:hypothetical protein